MVNSAVFIAVLALTCLAPARAILSSAGSSSHHQRIGIDPIPSWPRLFNMEFNETSIILFKRMTAGKLNVFPRLQIKMHTSDMRHHVWVHSSHHSNFDLHAHILDEWWEENITHIIDLTNVIV